MSVPLSTNTLFLITHEFYPKRGGIATFSEEIARACVTLGWDVEVWAQHAAADQEKSWPFRIWRLPLKGSHDFSCQLRLAVHLIRRRRELRHATVYLPEPGPMLTLMLLQWFHAFRPKNLVLTFHGSEILKFHQNPITRHLARQLIRCANRISVLTRYTRDLLSTHFPESRAKTILTPGTLRSDLAMAKSVSTDAHPRTIILTVGRIHPRKGQLITLEALKALAPRYQEQIEYWLVGSSNKPKYEQSLRDLAATCNFPVKFLGDRPDEELSGIYDQADIFALTSVDYGTSVEGFGLVYLEAAAHGLPVVAHSVGGVAEAVKEGETGLLVSPQQPAQLTAAFEKLVSDPALRKDLGQKGMDWARRHKWSDSARALFGKTLA